MFKKFNRGDVLVMECDEVYCISQIIGIDTDFTGNITGMLMQNLFFEYKLNDVSPPCNMISTKNPCIKYIAFKNNFVEDIIITARIEGEGG